MGTDQDNWFGFDANAPRPDMGARCEACHRMMPVAPDNPCTNPDWWFCDECREQSNIMRGRGGHRRYRLRTGLCAICDKDLEAGPWHDASPFCESGHRAHCSCDLCF